jgi:cell division transport system permease protein
MNRKFITAERIVKTGIVNFGRNVWLAIAAIAMMVITLTILLFAVVASVTFNHTIADITSHIDVSVYLKEGITDSQRTNLIKQVRQVDNVEAVTYISKEQALKTYEQQNATNSDLLAAISQTDNPLPASLTIKPKDANNLEPIRAFIARPDIRALQSDPSNDSGDRRKAIDNITKATHFFQQAGIVGIIVFVVISMLIIFNTIRMAIFNRRDELVIMRLLGASTAFIRGPFVVETMIYGLIAALISLAACAALFKIAASTLQASSLGLLDIGYSDRFFTTNLFKILTLQIAIGILIGAVSSGIATRRYLKLNK